MQNSIILQNVSTDQLTELIDNVVKTRFNDLKENFQPKQPAEYLTRQTVAQMFSVDISTISNWQKTGKLNPLAISGRVYFLRSDVEASLTPLNP